MFAIYDDEKCMTNNQARIIGCASLAQKSAIISNLYLIKSCQVNINIIQFYFVLLFSINYKINKNNNSFTTVQSYIKIGTRKISSSLLNMKNETIRLCGGSALIAYCRNANLCKC